LLGGVSLQMFLGCVRCSRKCFQAFCILSCPGESFPKSCPGVFKVIIGGAPPWSCTESGVHWDREVCRKYIVISTQCVHVPVCLENWNSCSPVALLSMAVLLTAWLIASYVTKLVLVVLFSLLAYPAVTLGLVWSHKFFMGIVWF